MIGMIGEAFLQLINTANELGLHMDIDISNFNIRVKLSTHNLENEVISIYKFYSLDYLNSLVYHDISVILDFNEMISKLKEEVGKNAG